MLVDTSVWIDHFSGGVPSLASLLTEAVVECHPFVIGELACGRLQRREEILRLLQGLPSVPAATHVEALALVARHGLAGAGIGWIDVHLLTSARLAGTQLWTRDQRLLQAARRVGVVAPLR